MTPSRSHAATCFMTAALILSFESAPLGAAPLRDDTFSPSDTRELVWTAPKGKSLHCQDQLIPFQFEGNIEEFSARDAFWMMWMALRTYVSGEESTRAELSRIGFTRYHALDHQRTGTQGFVTSNGQMTVIAFRGSTEWIDWVADFSFREIDGRSVDLGGKIHAGFAKALEGVWPQILQAVSAVGGTNQPLWVTGHSLGGALATLSAVRLAKLGYDLAPLYTFAAPREGNEDHAAEIKDWLKGKHFRIVNSEDLVARVPPTREGAADFGVIIPPKLREWAVNNLIGPLRYMHDGDLLWFDEEKKPWFMRDSDRTDDALYWNRVANLARTEGVEKMLRIVAQRQGDLHSEKTYACLLRGLYLNTSHRAAGVTLPASSTGRIRTL